MKIALWKNRNYWRRSWIFWKILWLIRKL